MTFERIVVAGDAAAAAFAVDENRRIVVSLERTDEDWDALDSRVLRPEGAFQSFRPSEHRADRWTITGGGFAPDGASRASIGLLGDQQLIPVIDRFYLFAFALDREPEFARLAVGFVE